MSQSENVTPVKVSPSTPTRSATQTASPNTTPIKKTSIETLKTITPVKMSPSTPRRSATQTASPNTTPIKKTSMETLKACTNSPLKKPALESVKTNANMFCEQLDTQIRACMFSVSANEMNDVYSTLDNMRKAIKVYHGQTIGSLSEAVLKTNAMTQKLSFQTERATNLATENAGLHLKNAGLHLKIGTLEHEIARRMAMDEEVFGKVFSEEQAFDKD